jgi:hypothetical protein
MADGAAIETLVFAAGARGFGAPTLRFPLEDCASYA